MKSSAPNPAPVRRSALRRVFKLSPSLALVGALTVLCLTAAACGAGGRVEATQPDQSEDGSPAPTPSPEPDRSSVNFMSTRPGVGIAAAGGHPSAIQGDNPCEQPGGAEIITIAYLGADLTELGAIGFEMTVVEDPILMIAAYVNEVNFNGGINGRCVELNSHLWSLSDPIGSFIEVCSDLSGHNPVFYFNFRLYDPGLECTTFGAPIPSIGLYTSVPESTIAESGYLLYADDGSVEHLLSRDLQVGLAAGVVHGNDRVGLLHGTGPSAGLSVSVAEEVAHDVGIDFVAVVDLPREFGDLSLLLPEMQVGLLKAGLSETEGDEAQDNLESLSPDNRAQLAEIERFFIEAATRFEEARVSIVIATSHWADMRRMMRAGELIDWTPMWLINDMQPATLVTADAPARQVHNLRQVSSRRAAGDVVPALDQGCITLRNTASEAAPFSHRPHTDAWNLITLICDYLDVSFSALTRIDGPIDHVPFLKALNETHYDTEYGGLITFSASQRHGATRFRVLAADPGCVLNFWGCMRSTTDWLIPEHQLHHEEVDPGEIRQIMEDLGHDHSQETEPEVDEPEVEEEADVHDHG